MSISRPSLDDIASRLAHVVAGAISDRDARTAVQAHFLRALKCPRDEIGVHTEAVAHELAGHVDIQELAAIAVVVQTQAVVLKARLAAKRTLRGD